MYLSNYTYKCYILQRRDQNGIRLQYYRRKIKRGKGNKKYTQENLAEKLDVSVAFLSKIERGKSHINLKRLSQLCDILGVSEGYILNGASNTSQEYLSLEFNSILENVSPQKQKLIYKIAKVIAEE